MLQEAKNRNKLYKQKIVGIKTNLFSSKILLFISFYTLNSFCSFQIILRSISSISVGHGTFSFTGKFHLKNNKSQVQNKLVHDAVQLQSCRETPEWKHITSIQQNFCWVYPRKL